MTGALAGPTVHTVTLNPSLDVEYVVPELRVGEVLIADQRRTDAGGKGVNVARAVGAVGGRAVAHVLVAGTAGELLVALASELPGVTLRPTTIAGETRTNIVVVPRARDQQLKVNELGPTTTADDVARLIASLAVTLQPGDRVALSGSLPPGLAADTYAELARTALAAGAVVAVDAAGPALAAAVRVPGVVVKPNAGEVLELTGIDPSGPDGAAAAARAVLALGAGGVLLSLGALGAVWATADGVLYVAAPRVRVANDVGAGDTLLGVFLARTAAGDDHGTALRHAVAASALAVALPGTAAQSATSVAEGAAGLLDAVAQG